jgi:hypothetical protein
MIAFAFHTAAQQRAASTIPPNNSGTVLGGTGTIGVLSLDRVQRRDPRGRHRFH